MAIQDTDYFLVENLAGESKKIQASKLRNNLYGNYADYKMLVNKPDWSSHKFNCVDMVSKLPPVGDAPYYLLVNRVIDGVWTPYKVDSHQAVSYFGSAFNGVWSSYFGENLDAYPGSYQGSGVPKDGPGGFNGNLTDTSTINSCRAYGDEGIGAGWQPTATIPCTTATIHAYNDFETLREGIFKCNDQYFTWSPTALRGNIKIFNVNVAADGGLKWIRWTNSRSNGSVGEFKEGNGMVGVQVDGTTLIDNVFLTGEVAVEYDRRVNAKINAINQARAAGFNVFSSLRLGQIAHDRIVNDWCLAENHIDEAEYTRRTNELNILQASTTPTTTSQD